MTPHALLNWIVGTATTIGIALGGFVLLQLYTQNGQIQAIMQFDQVFSQDVNGKLDDLSNSLQGVRGADHLILTATSTNLNL